MLNGNNSIIDQAGNAKNLTEQTQLEEEVDLAYVTYAGQLRETNDLEYYLNKIDNANVEKLAVDTWCVTRGTSAVTVSDDGERIAGKIEIWDGTSVEPTEKTSTEIHIYKCSELKWLQEQVSDGNNFNGYTIYLENNLDFGARATNGNWETTENNAKKWTPIGAYGKELNANFLGKNHTITGIYVNDSSVDAGIFGDAKNIKDLTSKRNYIKGGAYCGGLIGVMVNGGAIENCHNINTTVIGTEYVGGITGGAVANTNIINCSNSGQVTGTTQIGGIAGYTRNSISECNNSGIIMSKDAPNQLSRVGGIVGYSYNGADLDNCNNSGVVNGGFDVAGIVGRSEGTSITMCKNNNNISGIGQVGGIVGYALLSSLITNCENSENGSISATVTKVSGIVGIMEQSTIENSSNKGTIIGYGITAGVVGIALNSSSVVSCTNSGTINATDNQYIGEIFGYKDDSSTVN